MKKQKLSIITFNTLGIPFLTTHRHRNYLQISRQLLERFIHIAKVLNSSDADIIFLQEVHLYALLSYLRKKLTNYPYISYKRFLYGPKGGLVIFSKYKLADEEYLNFESRGTFKNKTFTTRIVRNGALICTLTDFPLTIMNTYITGDFSHKWGEENKYTPIQREQLHQLQEKVKEIEKLNRDAIIAGDFNIVAESALYKEFTKELSLTDFFKDATSYTHHPDFLPVWAKPPRLDHMFMTTKIYSISDSKTEELFTKKVILGNGKESFISDHIALKVTFEIHK